MPANKDFKRLVRGRMQKTGEAYTTARAHLLEQKPAAAVRPTAIDYPKLAGRSDAVLKEKTGKNTYAHSGAGSLSMFAYIL